MTKRKAAPEPEGQPVVMETPEPVSQGTYALFQTPKGGLHLAYRPEGTAEDVHLDIPPFVVNMAQKMANGETPGGLMGKMMGFGG